MVTEAIIASVIAGTSVCSDHFDNPTRYNPVDLTDYHECIIKTHMADETSGVMAFQLWVNLDGRIFSVPVAELQKQGSEAAALEYFQESVASDIIEMEIAAVSEQIEAIEDTIVDTITIDPRDIRIAELASAVQELSAYKTRIETNIANAEPNLESIPDYAEADVSAENVNINQGRAYYTRLTNGASVRRQSNLYTVEVNGTTIRSITVNEIEVGFVDYDSSGFPIPDTYRKSWDAIGVDFTEIEIAIENAFDKGYTSGYNTGYEEGYSAGYDHGFRDGVASVQ